MVKKSKKLKKDKTPAKVSPKLLRRLNELEADILRLGVRVTELEGQVIDLGRLEQEEKHEEEQNVEGTKEG